MENFNYNKIVQYQCIEKNNYYTLNYYSTIRECMKSELDEDGIVLESQIMEKGNSSTGNYIN